MSKQPKQQKEPIKFELKKPKAKLCPIKGGYCEKDRCHFWEEGQCLIKTLLIHLLFMGDKDSPIHTTSS